MRVNVLAGLTNGEWDHDSCEATVSTVGANHDIMKQNHLLASVILRNALSELCSRYKMPNGEMEEKMDKFIVNIIHRPEMVPEYAEKVTGHGKEENLGRKALLTESLDIFKFQQETAHKNGLKTTIQMTYASLFNDEAVALAKADHEKYGDEIALSLLGLV